MIGEQVGNFRIAAQLGKGGMGEVYLAEHVERGTRVAIKMLLPHVSANADLVQRFFNEAIAVAQIQHAGIGKIFDSGVHAGRAFLVMELLSGETLATRIRRAGRLPLSQVGELGRQIAGVLEAVHKAGITHRDLKPDNIFVVADDELPNGERIKIVDFGIAKLTGVGGGMTATTASALGTPAYMSPEQWKNAKHVDWRADAYSLGCVVFEMAAGRVPFIAETIGEACAKHLTEDAPSLASIVEVPPALDALVARMLEKSPDKRPTSLREIASTLAVLAETAPRELTAMQGRAPSVLPIAGQGATQVSMIRPSEQTTLGGASGQLPVAPRKPSFAPWIAIAAGVSLVAIAVLAVVMIRGGDDEVEPVALAVREPAEPPPVKRVVVEEAPPRTQEEPVDPPPPAEPRGTDKRRLPRAREPEIPRESYLIVTVPPKAKVKVVGKDELGETPLTIHLTPGKHNLAIRSINNELWFPILTVTAGQKGQRLAHTYPSGRPKKAELDSREIHNEINSQVRDKIFACRTAKVGRFAPMIALHIGPKGTLLSIHDQVAPSDRGRCIIDAIQHVTFPPSEQGGKAVIPYNPS